jgi:hypothetical protein
MRNDRPGHTDFVPRTPHKNWERKKGGKKQAAPSELLKLRVLRVQT